MAGDGGDPVGDEPVGDAPTSDPATPRRRGNDVYVARLSDRFLAWLVDTIIVSIPASIAFSTSGHDVSELYREPRASTFAIVLVAAFVYEVPLIATSGRTLGKRLRHLQVVHREDGSLPGWNTSATRWLTKWAGQLLSLIVPAAPGGLYQLVDLGFGLRKPLRQCLHDLAAKTVVISDR